MMKNRVMTLKVVDGLPEVPGAEFVSAEVPGLFIAYGPKVKGVNTRWTHPAYAYVWEWKKDNFVVFADKAAFTKIDPTNKGKIFTTWEKTPSNIAQWPWFKNDEHGVPTNVAALPSSCGPEDLVKNLDTATATVTP